MLYVRFQTDFIRSHHIDQNFNWMKLFSKQDSDSGYGPVLSLQVKAPSNDSPR